MPKRASGGGGGSPLLVLPDRLPVGVLTHTSTALSGGPVGTVTATCSGAQDKAEDEVGQRELLTDNSWSGSPAGGHPGPGPRSSKLDP